MSFLSDLRARLGSLFGRARADRELNEELRFHVAMQAEALEREGVPPEEARRRALIALGRIAQTEEETRDARGLRWLEDLIRDLRHARRQLFRTPGFTLTGILTLGLGIGATTAIFSVVDQVLLRRVPFEDPSRLVMVWETDRRSGTSHEPSAWPDFVDFRARATTLSGMATFRGGVGNLTPLEGPPVRVAAMLVSHEYFPLLGVKPLLGRVFDAEEDQPGGTQVVLLGETLWRARYAADPEVIGRTVRINENDFQVIGVLPASADFGLDQIHERADYHAQYLAPGRIEVWLPGSGSQRDSRQTHPFLQIGRLAPGADLAAAAEELGRIAGDLEAEYPNSNTARGANVESLDAVVFGPVRPVLLLLVVAVALVLVVACVNVANLLLARGATRATEIAVRSALGAGGRRLGRQFLVEALLLAGLGGVVGVGLAWGGLRALAGMLPADLPRADQIGLDLSVLGMSLVVTLVVGIVFGWVPTLQARRVDPMNAIRGEGGSKGGGRSRTRLREMLVVAELALSVALVLSAGLLVRSLWTVLRVDPGFEVERVVKAEYQLPQSRYPRDFSRWPAIDEIQSFNRQLLDEAARIPGAASVALAGAHPLDRGFTNSFVVVGREAESENWPELALRVVSPGYFETMGLTLTEGRLIDGRDRVDGVPVAMINEAARRRFFEDREPVGQQIRFWGTSREVIGVVSDERFYGVTEEAPPATYVPLVQAPMQGGVLLVRMGADPRPAGPLLRDAIRAIDPELAVYGVEPLAETLRASVAERRFTALLIGLFAAITVLLALVGIHGVISYATAQRSQEIGLRVALGATGGQVTGMVMRSGLVLAVVGTGLGLIGAMIGSALLRGLLFGVGRFDPLTYLAVPVIVLGATALATLLPALRASRAEPVEVLRGAAGP
ncbi:MAG: ABC transporter permease [Gemmatimonadales bacterium]